MLSQFINVVRLGATTLLVSTQTMQYLMSKSLTIVMCLIDGSHQNFVSVLLDLLGYKNWCLKVLRFEEALVHGLGFKKEWHGWTFFSQAFNT